MISAIIPSYRSPKMLDLCLKSATENRVMEDTEIVVVLDGFADESKEVIEKYNNILVLPLPENRGHTIAHNYGVFMASRDWVLIANDDNIFPTRWDEKLTCSQRNDFVVAPNQIEPTPSIFKSFVIKDLGTNIDNFQYEEFLKFEQELHDRVASSTSTWITNDGQTWPLYMQKKWFMALGGVDNDYPYAAVADWDFFVRCELAGLTCVRSYYAHFYHFAGATLKKTPEQQSTNYVKEQQSFQYFEWKWGYQPRMDEKNSRMTNGKVRGIQFKNT